MTPYPSKANDAYRQKSTEGEGSVPNLLHKDGFEFSTDPRFFALRGFRDTSIDGDTITGPFVWMQARGSDAVVTLTLQRPSAANPEVLETVELTAVDLVKDQCYAYPATTITKTEGGDVFAALR